MFVGSLSLRDGKRNTYQQPDKKTLDTGAEWGAGLKESVDDKGHENDIGDSACWIGSF